MTQWLNVKILHPDAALPSKAHPGDAGFDLIATYREWDELNKCYSYNTGISVEIPEGYVGLIYPRSSIYRTSFLLNNSVGVIDSGYRGEIKLIFKDLHEYQNVEDESLAVPYEIGAKIGQLVIMQLPKFILKEVDELSDSNRGTNGFGSSGT